MCKPFAVDSHRNMLAEARSLLKWCVARRWLAQNPLDGVEGKGGQTTPRQAPAPDR